MFVAVRPNVSGMNPEVSIGHPLGARRQNQEPAADSTECPHQMNVRIKSTEKEMHRQR